MDLLDKFWTKIRQGQSPDISRTYIGQILDIRQSLDKLWSLSRVCLMSRICPIHVLFMSRICPCLMFVRTLSRKSNFCPLQIQFLSSNPPFVQYLSSFFGIIPQKFARQTLDNFLTSSLYHLQPGYPAFGQNLDKLRILVFHETE